MSEITDDKSHYPASEPASTTAVVSVVAAMPAIRQADSDDQLIELWLHGRSRHTQRAYRADAAQFQAFTGRPLRQVRLLELQSFADALEAAMTPASRNRTLSAVKSLFSFGHGLGYLPFDTARPLKLPILRDQLSSRILDESAVQRMLALEANPRNSAILSLLYAAGLRVSELCGLKWADVIERTSGMGQLTVFGNGGKTREIIIPSSVKAKLDRIRRGAADDEPMFKSRRSRPISASQVLRIVKAAAKRASIESNVVVHTLRHCHASHSLERGAPIHLVQQTLGHSDLSTTGRYLHARPSDSSGNYLPL